MNFLRRRPRASARLSGGTLRLVWAATENLGDWTIVRKRLSEEMQRKQGAPLASGFAQTATAAPDTGYFAWLAEELRGANSIAWNPEHPARIETGGGKHSWPLGNAGDGIPLARHTALTDDDNAVAEPAVLGSRAAGRPIWGVLRGDVDDFGIRLRKLDSIEEHVQVSVMYKQFFAGELEVLASLPEFWRRVTLLYSGGDDFALYGAWDALIGFARELKRLLQRFCDESLKDFPGQEGKTITMALALAPEADSRLDAIFERAGERLNVAKATDKDCFHLLGRTLEWKQVADAAELKEELTRMVSDFGASPEYIRELCGIYRESRKTGGARAGRVERPWRFHRRLNRILGSSRSREYQKARASLVTDLAGKNPSNLKLRPSGRVALEWARLSVETADAQAAR